MGVLVNSKLKLLGPAAVLAAVTFAASPAIAQAAPHPAASTTMARPAEASDSYFQIVSAVNNDLCIGISGGSLTPGAHAVAYTCLNHADQFWTPTDCTSNGQYCELENLDDVCLALDAGSTFNGNYVIGYTCLNSPSKHPDQYWEFGNDGQCGGFPIVDMKDGRVIGMQGGVVASGTDLVEWNDQHMCNNQQWYTDSN
jgi:hypothetical protein